MSKIVKGNQSNPNDEDSLNKLTSYIKTLKNKAFDVEQARQKVTSDVEKLIKNQETFEKRVSEMDQVYQMLTTEQKKLS
jgi:Spy/CpxP family protein refolding chaperone